MFRTKETNTTSKNRGKAPNKKEFQEVMDPNMNPKVAGSVLVGHPKTDKSGPDWVLSMSWALMCFCTVVGSLIRIIRLGSGLGLSDIQSPQPRILAFKRSDR